MRKKIELIDGKLSIDLYDFVDAMDDSAMENLIDYLSCEEKILKNVTDQLLNYFTDLGSRGLSGSASDVPSTALEVATRRIAKDASTIAKSEIERLEGAVEFMTKTKDEYMKNYFILYHAWPRDHKPMPKFEDRKA